MVEHISDVPISSIQNIDFSTSVQKEEIDLVDKDQNIVFVSENGGEEIDIDFTLLKKAHPERLSVEKQEDEVKELVSNDASQNYFRYDNSDYFLAIGDVSISESGDLVNIREGTITAQAYPWPKHFENEEVSIDKRTSGDILIASDLEGQLDEVSAISSLSDKSIALDMRGDGAVVVPINQSGDILFDKEIVGDINKEASVEGDASFFFNLGEGSFGHDFGENFGSFLVVLNLEESIESELLVSSEFFGNLYKEEFGNFGRYFGRSFGSS